MQEGLRAGVESLAEVIASKEAELAELKRAANVMCQQAGMVPRYAATTPTDTTNGPTLKMRPDGPRESVLHGGAHVLGTAPPGSPRRGNHART